MAGFSGKPVLMGIILMLILTGVGLAAYASIQTLLLAASVRSTAVKIEEYNSAVFKFFTKYDDFPGDTRRGSAFGLNGETGSNGNGNGRLDDGIGTEVTSGFASEHHSLWVHLSEAGFITENYDTPLLQAGDAFPLSPLGEGGVIALSEGGRNYWLVGTAPMLHAGSTEGFVGNTLLPLEAAMLDEKMDDSIPTAGKIMVINEITADKIQVATEADAPACLQDALLYRHEHKQNSCTVRINMEQKY